MPIIIKNILINIFSLIHNIPVKIIKPMTPTKKATINAIKKFLIGLGTFLFLLASTVPEASSSNNSSNINSMVSSFLVIL